MASAATLSLSTSMDALHISRQALPINADRYSSSSPLRDSGIRFSPEQISGTTENEKKDHFVNQVQLIRTILPSVQRQGRLQPLTRRPALESTLNNNPSSTEMTVDNALSQPGNLSGNNALEPTAYTSDPLDTAAPRRGNRRALVDENHSPKKSNRRILVDDH